LFLFLFFKINPGEHFSQTQTLFSILYNFISFDKVGQDCFIQQLEVKLQLTLSRIQNGGLVSTALGVFFE
jgi:hypothetical protein